MPFAWLPDVRLVFLVSSFVFLFLYGVQMLLLVSPRNLRLRAFRFSLFGIYALIIGFGAVRALKPIFPVSDFLDGSGPYLLAVPAAMLAALALRAQARTARQDGRMALSRTA